MCVVSNVGGAWNPIIPQVPPVWPQPVGPSAPPQKFAPPVVPGLTNEELRELIETYRTAKAAAQRADEITGQPDCVDPEKIKLEERIAELERRLELIEHGETPEPS